MSNKPDDQAAAGHEKLQIDIDENTAVGAYSNLLMVNHSDCEFALDFAYVTGPGRARVRSRVITSPRHAKRILAALAENLRRFEQRFGAIVDHGPHQSGGN